ncbi:DNA translocase FtsK [Gottfriedia solisilvae]|uniref:DNA translocase FtsK n=1 Tax=Gottfriedia solisilvae TaxID=1516104 RepID=A0A8J3ABW7_9BACI|nr:DNA translocase FtsK [Gottfriedia solisilvae]GGI10037.1 DNA translocase FtsK [Gottfriedia solisilvae]
MKKWLKSLFKGDSLNEMKNEIDEKPSDARVIQSHSIDIKKQDEFERPNFRFPLQLDDDVIVKEEQHHEVDTVFQKQKNYDFWQNSASQPSNQMNKENNQTSFKQREDLWQSSTHLMNQSNREKIQPSYNQREDFWQETTNSKNQLHREEVQSVYKQQKNNFTRSEVTQQTEKAIPEKEEKVDIVFRPKRKTPFRPSEYISPIYGYQKPDSSTNEVLSDPLLKRDEASLEEKVQSQNEVNQIQQNQTFNEKQQNQNDSIESEGNSIILSKNQNVELVEDVIQAKTHDYEMNETEVLESIEEKEAQTDLNSEAMQNGIQNNIEDIVVAEIELTQDEKLEEPKVTEFIDTCDSTNLVTDYYELRDEESSQDEERNESYKKEYVSDEQNRTEDEAVELLEEIKKNGYVTQNEDCTQIEQVSDCEEEVQNETTEESMSEIEDSEDLENLVVNEQLDSIEEEIVTTSDQLQNEHKTIVEHSETSIKEASQESKTTPEKPNEEKREKKRNFPFNVMMLRSDVEASRKANIMRQLRELQSEAAATLEKVDKETEAHVLTDENSANSIESEIVIEQNSIDHRVNESSSKQQTESMHEVPSTTDDNIKTMHEVTPTKDDSTEMKYEVTPINDDNTESLQNENVREEIVENTFVKQTDEVIIEEINSNETTPNQYQEVPVMPPVLYELPELGLLAEPPVEQFNDGDWVEAQKELLQETLQNFNVGAKVIAATQGPTVTRFEVQPDPGVKVNKITNLQDDIKLSLAARDIRIEAPIPGRSAIGIEVPNRESKPVFLSELVSKDKFLQSESPLTVALGLDIGGEPVFADISKMPHGLIAGATGSGKSVCINSILVSILYKAKPHEVKLILIDPKMVELAPYNHIPHLISPVITDARAATAALKWACDEMDRRYDLFAHAGARDIKRFNDLAKKKSAFNDELPYLVIVIDELADLMMVSPGDVETYICRIAQKARACGIHLLVATQRPSVDVITGIIKSNIPTRIAFTVSSQVDSRTIIDIGGAEKLLGRGDMLFLDNGKSQAIRLQGVYVSDDEIEHVVEIVKDQQKPNYLFNQEELVAKADAHDVDDELFEEAVEFVIDQKGASVSMLQRRFRIGYNRAARLVDLMFDHGIVSNQNGSKPRDVLMTLEQFHSEE